jgi:hypothetical protein
MIPSLWSERFYLLKSERFSEFPFCPMNVDTLKEKWLISMQIPKKWLVCNRVGVTATDKQCLALAGIVAEASRSRT